MIQVRLVCWLMLFSCCTLTFAKAVTLVEKEKFAPVDALHTTWVFSGIVMSESYEEYGYYFQLQRDNAHFHATVALFDEVSKKILFREESDAVIDHVVPYDWHVGRAFLTFNPINDSWIFGVKPKNNLGFNFKVDMLKQFANAPNFHHLRSGVNMMVSQTSELNGHILTGDSRAEQFVTTKEAWFRQIWQEGLATNLTPELTSVLCQFHDGSRFYSVNLHESDAESGAIAGWYNADGVSQAMSQFVQVSHSKEGTWHVQSKSPHLDLVLSSAVEQNSVVAGFVDGTKNPGFCMLNNQTNTPTHIG